METKVNYCCVPWCKSRRSKKGKISFFEFPSKIGQRTLWQNIIRRTCTNLKLQDRSVVCEKHFTEEDFSKSSTKRKRILPGVVPSVFKYIIPTVQKNTFHKRKSSNVPLNPLLKNSCLTKKLETNISSNASRIEKNSLECNNFTQSSASHSGEAQTKINCTKEYKQINFSSLSNENKSCCVPNCISVQRGEENLSFFEFPSNLQQRTWWEKVISQVAIKSGNSWKSADQSVVCGKHFIDTDFSKNTTKRILLPGVVPSVLSNFASDMQQELFSQEKDSNEINPEHSLNQTVELHSEEIKNEKNSNERTKQLIKKLHRRISTLRKINSNLRFRLKGLNQKSSEEKLYRKIFRGKLEHKLPAIMLYEQIKNFGKSKVTFSKTALKLYFLWEERSPKSYDFVRNMRIFTLPHKNTLNKYLEFSKEETKVRSNNINSDEIEDLEA